MRSNFLSLLLCILLCGGGTGVLAQTNQGYLFVGGHANANFSQGDKVLAADIAPTVGVFVRNGLAVGGNVQVGVVRYGSQNNHTTLGLYPMARYYFESRQPLRFFIQGDIGYHRRTAEAYLRHGYGASINPGLAYFLNEFLAVESFLRIGGHRYTDGNSSAEIGFRLGLQFYLRQRPGY